MTRPIDVRARRFRTERLLLCLLQVLAAAVVAWTIVDEHRRVEAREGDRLEVQARVVEENVIRQLEGANTALDSIGGDLSRKGAIAVTAATSDKLKLLTDVMPGISSMLVLDAGGTVVASSREGLVGKNFQQREYFDEPRRAADAKALYVSPPFRTSLGTFVIVLSRALLDARGEFVGVVTATLDPDYFNVVLRSVLYAPDMRTTLIHGDGKVFLNMPLNSGALGADLSRPGTLFAKHKESGLPATLASGEAVAVGDSRLMAIRNISRGDLRMNKPLVVAVGREMSAVYLSWRERSTQFLALWLVLFFGSTATLFLNQRRRLAAGAAAAEIALERQVASERVELALRGADLGLWDLRLPEDRFVVSARERAMLGFEPGDEIPQGAAWHEHVHPDDREAVVASIQAHLRGEAPNYECEHRMRRKDGGYIWVSNRAMIVERDRTGAPTRIVGTHLDITERRRAEAELALAASLLRDSEDQLRQVTDNMPALVSRFDAHQRLGFVNRAYRDWLGIEPESLMGRSLRELYGEVSYARFRHHIESALAGNRVVYERELATPRGARQVEVTLVPQRGAEGAVHGVYALITDMTERHEAETRRALSEERLSLALEGSGQALFDWDLRTGQMYHSAQAAAMRGEPPLDRIGPATELQAHVHPEDLAGVLVCIATAIKGETPFYYAEFRLGRLAGGWVWIRAQGRVVERDGAGRALRLAGTYADISQRRATEERLRRLAEIDGLTGLPNRVLFQDRLLAAMGRAAEGKSMALMFLDVDHFKSINDTLGHEAGDTLLKVFARRMQGAVRQSDVVARLGGDEFTIILEGLRDAGDASTVASNLVEALREPIALDGRAMVVTASVGMTLCVPGESDDAALLRRADEALYEAKRRGRNGYYCHSGDSSWQVDAEEPHWVAPPPLALGRA